ncbi:hypothetical protein J6590_013286 [Homalodisca vitripennis]|nr:hypothetical protein J6590_013286 [Homalodisca vitripennis]
MQLFGNTLSISRQFENSGHCFFDEVSLENRPTSSIFSNIGGTILNLGCSYCSLNGCIPTIDILVPADVDHPALCSSLPLMLIRTSFKVPRNLIIPIDFELEKFSANPAEWQYFTIPDHLLLTLIKKKETGSKKGHERSLSDLIPPQKSGPTIANHAGQKMVELPAYPRDQATWGIGITFVISCTVGKPLPLHP